ncbi:diguanylate cyclase [Lysinibacillus sp. ZYM-1]|uniref:diguanylate cyclase n=1 Tax=Lysinibacillus sp. ZYM-1 TaxID=1681184 RepID=UPI0006CEA23C|nr:diguanylate cyclase [Lysinibacillus sp. ZYM-1]KPN93078.1 response regulator receiver protein [Lysinibacillus sp. ZYM-1]
MENQEKVALSIRKEMVRLNLKGMRTVAWTLMYVSAVISFIHFGEIFFAKTERAMVPAYITIHTIMFYIDVAVLLFVREKRMHITSGNIQKYENLVIVYIYTIMLLITAISVMDVFFFQHAALYEVILIIVCTVFALPFRKMVWILFLSAPVIIISAYMSVGVSSENIKIILPMSLLIPIGVMIQYQTYKVQKQFKTQHILLDEEMTKTKQLSELLAAKNDELSKQALKDTLTNLPNRRAFNNKLSKLGQRLPKPQTLTIIMIDIDFFKNFNDYYGHLQGDAAIVKVASLLKEIAEKYNAFVARWGGEEFIMVSQHTPKFAEPVCEEILEEVRSLNMPHAQSDVAQCVTVSIGICHGKITKYEHLQTCCELADQALYLAKQNGRNNFYCKKAIFDETANASF